MTVSQIMRYAVDKYFQEFTIYDVDKGENVFTGYIEDCPEEYIDAEICSIDTINEDSPRLTFNVTLEQ